jgi:hypothetical protein
MRCITRPVAAATIFAVASTALLPAAPPSDTEEEPKKPGKKVYLRHAFGKGAFVTSTSGAVWDHIRTSPYEWGGGVAGFGRRFASTFSGHMIKSTVHYTVARIRHEELDYQRSGLEGFTPRLRYAVLRTVITRKTTTGESTFSSGEVAGAVTSGFLSRLWYPARLHTFSGGLASSGISLGADAGFNVAREFWPEIRHPKQSLQSKRESRARGKQLPAD